MGLMSLEALRLRRHDGWNPSRVYITMVDWFESSDPVVRLDGGSRAGLAFVQQIIMVYTDRQEVAAFNAAVDLTPLLPGGGEMLLWNVVENRWTCLTPWAPRGERIYRTVAPYDLIDFAAQVRRRLCK